MRRALPVHTGQVLEYIDLTSNTALRSVAAGSWHGVNLVELLQRLPTAGAEGSIKIEFYLYANKRENTQELSDEGEALEAAIARALPALSSSMRVTNGKIRDYPPHLHFSPEDVPNWRLSKGKNMKNATSA